MTFLTSEDHFTKISAIQSLPILILIAFTGFAFIGPFVGIVAAIPFYKGSAMEMFTAMSNPVNNEDLKVPLYIAQACATLTGFIILPYIYAKAVLNITRNDVINRSLPGPLMSLVVIVVVIAFMGANSIFIEWNSNLELPEVFSGFERWARSFEDRAQEITQYLTNFKSGSEFAIAMIVIAVLPALGEEFVFRGLIQNHLQVITRNIHLSIWIAAILFSLFHIQFFGFIPRVLLGALFGYLYAWSGNLAYPVIAHFVNNGFTLLMMYLYNTGAVSFDIESTESVPISTVLISIGITSFLLYIFKSYFRKDQIGYE